MRGRGPNIVPFRRRRLTPARDYKRRSRWTDGITPFTIMLPLATFTAVFVWDGVHHGFPAALDFTPQARQEVPRPAHDTPPVEPVGAAVPTSPLILQSPVGPLPDGAAPGVAKPGWTQDSQRARFTRCGGFSRSNCVVDGDTFWYRGTKIRIADINTPEVSSPGCAYEADLGEQASRRLLDLLNEGAFSLAGVDRDEDKYGRKLRVVTRDGQSLGEVLVSEGLAERWQGFRRDWCEGLS